MLRDGLTSLQQSDPIDQISQWAAGVSIDLVPSVQVIGFTNHLAQNAGGSLVLLAPTTPGPFVSSRQLRTVTSGWKVGSGSHTSTIASTPREEQELGALELVVPGGDVRVMREIARMHLQMQRSVVCFLVGTGSQNALSRGHRSFHSSLLPLMLLSMVVCRALRPLICRPGTLPGIRSLNTLPGVRRPGTLPGVRGPDSPPINRRPGSLPTNRRSRFQRDASGLCVRRLGTLPGSTPRINLYFQPNRIPPLMAMFSPVI